MQMNLRKIVTIPEQQGAKVHWEGLPVKKGQHKGSFAGAEWQNGRASGAEQSSACFPDVLPSTASKDGDPVTRRHTCSLHPSQELSAQPLLNVGSRAHLRCLTSWGSSLSSAEQEQQGWHLYPRGEEHQQAWKQQGTGQDIRTG